MAFLKDLQENSRISMANHIRSIFHKKSHVSPKNSDSHIKLHKIDFLPIDERNKK